MVLELFTFTKKGLYCKPGDFYIDPWQPVDKAVITHSHADHARWGMKNYLCHDFSLPILKSRIMEDIKAESLPYGKTVNINGVKLSLYPAGHIIGSAQVRLEYKGYVSVVTGDYKTEDDGITTPFETVKCHEFITESTFGLPVYRWKPQDIVTAQMHDWVINNQKQDKTSVFTAYSLGKAQRIMKLLNGLGRIYVHNSVVNMNAAIEKSGIILPEVSLYQQDMEKKQLTGQIVIIPPAAMSPQLLKKIPRAALAACSGWMQIRGNRRWQAADAGFAISDHADWDGLLSAVKASEAEKIVVTHGYTEPFARYLNEMGYNASAVETRFGEDANANQ